MKIEPIAAFTDNYIWLLSDETNGIAAVVDPGDAEPVLKELQRRALRLTSILITHHHGDHVGGIADLVAHTQATVYGPKSERIPKRTHPLTGGDCIELADLSLSLRVMDVPGHTAGHIAYFTNRPHSTSALFCGDTLFAAGCGRLFEGTPQQMHRSLDQIRALPGHTQVYCAHEYTLDNLGFARRVEPSNPALVQRDAAARRRRQRGAPTVPSSLALERATNPFLRYDDPVVVAAASRYANRPLTPGWEVFAVTRQWKDDVD